MTRTIRAELTQLRTLRSTYGVLAVVVLLAIAIAVGDFSNAGKPHMRSLEEFRDELTTVCGLVTAVAFGLFAASRVGGEYRHSTIGQRALAAPRRWRLVTARCVTYGALAAIMTMVTVAAVTPVANAVAAHKGVSLGLSASDVAGVTGQAVAGSVLFAILGVAVGFVTRNPTAAILTILGVFIGEQLFADVLGPVGRYMPYQLLNSLLDVGAIAPLAGGLMLAAMTAAITSACVLLVVRRDVL